ncbi:hypothetical protein [Halomonas cerina]|uniref:Uncharacterized protein n=1 Tax=Halomonas cerina TaxID=447424 RepID=A0A839VAV5_9GAMM|nr:hypothetical protein [Halomonas cerina]MBB3192271.1 hypothetical protein [Halomonas cerina]
MNHAVTLTRNGNCGLIDRTAPATTPEDDRQTLGEALAAGGARRTRELPIQAEAADPRAWLAQRRHALPASEVEEPAPVRVIEALEAALLEPFDAALARERALFVACRDSPQRQAKVEAFLARKHDRARPNGARHDDSRGSTA